MTWKIIFATGAFGGIAPILLQLAIDLTQGRKRVEAIGLSILVGMALYALLGGGLSLIWKETDLKKVFYIGLGLPSLLTIASANVTAPQLPSQPIAAPTVSVPQQAPIPGRGEPKARVNRFEFFSAINSTVYAQTNIAARQLVVDLISQAVPTEITQSPLYIVFEPTGSNAPIQYGQAIVSVPPTATSFRVEGATASSDSIGLSTIPGSTTRVRFGAEKRSWYGFLYSLGVKAAPYQLVQKSVETNNSVASPDDPIASQISLVATSKAVSSNQNGNRYGFSLSVGIPDSLKDKVARAEYDLEYNSNPLWLTSDDATTNFHVRYEGWGCYQNVDVTVIFKDPGMQPRKKHFDMCAILGW
jgi:hypothetical protein